jgi:nitroreductase
MWDFFETVRHRHSVRRFRDLPVEREKMHAILEMASAAPSAGDLQAYRIIAVSTQQGRRDLSRIAGEQNFLAEAPLCLVFCADPLRSAAQYGDRGRNLYALQDATIAATYAQLAIVAAGLGSTWVGSFDEDALAQHCQLDAGLLPVAILAVGYPAEFPEPTPRRHLDEMVQYR